MVDQVIRYNLIRKKFPPGKNLFLEVGCGHGELLSWLNQDGSIKVFGCEPSDDLYDASDEIKRSRLTKATGTNLPYQDNFFDCAFSSDVLEHVSPQDRIPFIKEMIRVTKPSGTIVFSVFMKVSFAFRMFGILHGVFANKIPKWYTEHVETTLPSYPDIVSTMEQECRNLSTTWYQGYVNIAGLAFQTFLKAPRLKRLVTPLIPCIAALDFIGRKTSCVFSAIKN